MEKRRSLRNLVDLGLELDGVDQKALEELSQLLGDLLVDYLSKAVGAGIEFRVSLVLELGDTLNLAVDIALASPVPITPEILAEVDKHIDKAISKFEEVVALKYGKKRLHGGGG